MAAVLLAIIPVGTVTLRFNTASGQRVPVVLSHVCACHAINSHPSSMMARRGGRPRLSVMDASVSATRAELLARCSAAPPNGVGASLEEDNAVHAIVTELEVFCRPEPTRMPLSGVWQLVYTSSTGGSSGKVGPFVGRVTQTMVDDSIFINAVEFFGGAVRLALEAEREVLDSKRIRVTFRETAVSVFGRQVFRKAIEGSGVWVQRYVDEGLRVMDTPSLFVLRKVGDVNDSSMSV